MQPEQVQTSDCCVSLDLKTEISSQDPILTTTASITPKLLFHLPLLMHCHWFPKSQESKISLVRNKRNYTNCVDAWSSFSFQEPIACCISSKSGLCPLYSVSFVFIYFVDGTVEGNYQTHGCFSGFVCWRQESREKIPKTSPSWCHTWAAMVLVGGAKEDLSPPSDVHTAGWVLLSQEPDWYAAAVPPSQSQQGWASKWLQKHRCTGTWLTQRKKHKAYFLEYEKVLLNFTKLTNVSF